MNREPRIGFVSLGCPKALVDSEQILTRLRAEGYGIVPNYEEADLVVVNTCGFIDSAVAEVAGRHRRGDGGKRPGDRYRLSGCERKRGPRTCTRACWRSAARRIRGGDDADSRASAPAARSVSGSRAPDGIKLTPRHYAYLKIAEGCNHRCTFCIIPRLRGNLVSRPIDEVLREAEHLVRAGVQELLVMSQDTSAYGVDVRYRPAAETAAPQDPSERLDRRPGRTRRMVAVALRLSVSPCRSTHTADGSRPGPAISGYSVPTCQPTHPESHEAAGQGRRKPGPHPEMAGNMPGSDHSQHVHRRISRRNRG